MLPPGSLRLSQDSLQPPDPILGGRFVELGDTPKPPGKGLRPSARPWGSIGS